MREARYAAHLVGYEGYEVVPDHMEDEEEGHEEVKDVIHGKHLDELQQKPSVGKNSDIWLILDLCSFRRG